MSKLLIVTLGLLLVASSSCTSLKRMQEQVSLSGSSLVGANFHVLVLAPSDVAKELSRVHINQVKVAESVHTVDAISAFVEQFRKQGGSARNLDLAVRDPEAREYVKERALSFYTRQMTDVPLRFSRKGKDALVLPFKSIQSCINDSSFHYTFEQSEDGSFVVTTPEGEIEFSESEFLTTMTPFFTEACAFIQLAKHQVATTEKTGLAFQFDSLKSLMSSKLSNQAQKIVNSLIKKFEEEAQAIYGEGKTSLHVVFYSAAPHIRARSVRILEEAKVSADVSDDYMHTIKYSFSIVFMILLAIICINFYTMDIYKDSLIYAKFLVKKNN